jgi:hypothetical protein
MTTAIVHVGEGDVLVLDAVAVSQPPLDPEAAVEDHVALMRRYGVSTALSDKFAGEWARSAFLRRGIELNQSARPKSDLYHDFLPLIASRRIELLDNPRLIREFAGLERKTARSGRDSIDHAPNLHDDLANVVAGAFVNAELDRRPALIDLKDVVGGPDARPDGPGGAVEPRWIQFIFLMLAVEGPDIAALFCGYTRGDPERSPPSPLYILDVEAAHYRPGLFGELVQRLKDMATSRHSQVVFVMAPEHLVGQIPSGGLMVESWPKDFDADLWITFASECAGRGLVRFCPPVVAKMSVRPIAAALALRAGDPAETVLRIAFVAAIRVTHAGA